MPTEDTSPPPLTHDASYHPLAQFVIKQEQKQTQPERPEACLIADESSQSGRIDASSVSWFVGTKKSTTPQKNNKKKNAVFMLSS